MDVSTSITGATVLDKDGACIYNEFWDTRNKNKFPTHFDKARFLREKLKSIKSKFKIDKVYIEKPFMFFNSGGSSAKTMSSLQNYNGMISWICSDMFAKDPKYFTASEARKIVGIKVLKGENAKQKTLNFVIDSEPLFVIEYTKAGNPRPGTMDKSDSYVIAKAGHIVCSQKS